jgi:transcriptional regulator with XRE-family HTH domain
MDGNDNTIAERLRVARETAGLTQGQAAKLLGLHRPSVSEIEAGRRKVSSNELKQFADIYGVGMEWLAGEGAAEEGPRESRIKLAARELANLSEEDLDKLLSVIHTLKRA